MIKKNSQLLVYKCFFFTIKIILGLIDDYDGDVYIFGEKVKGKTDYKRKIGYVPEISDMYDNLTAHEYISFIGMLYGIGSLEAVSKAKEMMSVFGIEDAIDGTVEEVMQKQSDTSLESIFNDVTGFHDHQQLADRFVSAYMS